MADLPNPFECVLDADGVLEKMRARGYRSVVVFGLTADNEIEIEASKGVSRLEFIGALEAAKMEMWGVTHEVDDEDED